MNIAIDGRGINWYNGSGIGTYTENLLKNLLSIDTDNSYQIYWSGENYESYKTQNSNLVMCSKKYQRFFQDNFFPENLKTENIDLYHVPQNGIGLNQDIHCKKVATIHDLIPYIMPETVGRGYLLKFLKELPLVTEISSGLITVSEYSKRDILRFFPMDEDKIFVTPLAADKKYVPLDKEKCKAIIKEKYQIDKPFMLYVGGFSKRKNVYALITSFAKLKSHMSKEYNLVIVGSYRDESQELVKLVDKLNMGNYIKFTGFAPDEDLPIYYNACECFVYPSLYEGFGLPPLEAMSCGTPVISCDTTSIPEVVGHSGILINPYKDNTLQNAMELVLGSETLRCELSRLGLAKSKEFSWENTARKTLEAYAKLGIEN
ncbi:MAG: glycosyltransferase family 1 protein [Clostridium sp.]|uniref:glycosyltransferase family 4 protein n=2 Tax=Clostridium sp. TaxID=1506 RepID=UPI0030250578